MVGYGRRDQYVLLSILLEAFSVFLLKTAFALLFDLENDLLENVEHVERTSERYFKTLCVQIASNNVRSGIENERNRSFKGTAL